MGVQATMTIGSKKSAAFATVTTGLATYPAANQVRTIAMLAGEDINRFADIERAHKICMDYARDNNVFINAGAIAIVTTLDGGKAAVREESLAASVVTGDVGLMVVGNERVKGYTNIADNAYRQLIDASREQTRLGA